MTAPYLDTCVAEIRALRDMTIGEVQRRYAEVMGKATKSFNGPALRYTIARRLTERAREVSTSAAERRRIQRAVAEVRSPRPAPAVVPHDPRIPPVGTVLRRRHRDEEIEVKVTRTGFTFRGRAYGSLSAVAREVTGARWNGLLYFGLTARKRGARAGRRAT